MTWNSLSKEILFDNLYEYMNFIVVYMCFLKFRVSYQDSKQFMMVYSIKILYFFYIFYPSLWKSLKAIKRTGNLCNLFQKLRFLLPFDIEKVSDVISVRVIWSNKYFQGFYNIEVLNALFVRLQFLIATNY